MSMTLSPAALVWTMRTVAAERGRVARAASARATESLVFIATHFKLPGHVADPLFKRAVPTALQPGLSILQDEGAAAAGREAAGARPLHHVPLAEHGVPRGAAAEGADRLHRRGNPEELRGRREDGAAGCAAEKPAADDAALARGRRDRIPPRREALGIAVRRRVEDPAAVGQRGQVKLASW